MSKCMDQPRVNLNGELDEFGRLFVCPLTARITDLSSVQVLRCAVDTVRQLYRGSVSADVLQMLTDAAGLINWGGYDWHAGRIGRDSGYQFKLQNADLGLVILIKNHNVKAEIEGPHLKFEVSPHLIDELSPVELQNLMDELAAKLLTDCKPNQAAVHIALDVQGWLPDDVVSRMHCRARAQREFVGVERIEFDERVAVYGRGKSYLFGSAGGLQLAIYNKTDQAKATDKLDYWESVWSDAYTKDQDVWRIELRFHHSIVDQFAQGSACIKTGAFIDTRTYAEICPHLDGLWRYGLTAYKLLATDGVYDAFWTFARSSVAVSTHADSLASTVEYRRYYKSAAGFTGKNVELFMGNFVSLLARERVGATQAFERLKEWECWPVIRDHFEEKGKSERDIYKWLRDKLAERTIRWGKAV